MKIYTRKGDEGETALLGGTRVPKHHDRIEAYGTVDELNSALGWLSDQPGTEAFIPLIREIQHHLFAIGAVLANDPERSHFELPGLPAGATEALEHSIDLMETELPPLRNFVLPGGHPANSAAHLARCICRRAERCVTSLHEAVPQDPAILQYLNRLSDWLFVFSRLMSHRNGAEEVLWKPA
ncbi:MAG: cob(I)yrinic acid a,c-diamide adenosyltransferase [Bacteroidia bacterium]|nr:cob(I)yrinic acid a,c-diamide adenosyltransferase [Bacteroidia bacterium]